MIPKIRFEYSWIYDSVFEENFKKNPPHFAPKKYPSPEKIKKFIEEVKPLWKKYENKVLIELSKVSGLKWKDSEIKAYVVGITYPFSDPLTLPKYKDKTWFIDCLIHELIHQLFTQKNNEIISKDSWNFTYKKYKKESLKTKIHIPLHAIHKHIYLKFFGEGRLERELSFMSKHEGYRQSWQIVNEEGHQNIIKEFKKRLKEIKTKN